MDLDAFLDELEKIGASASDSNIGAYLAAGGITGVLAGAGAFIARRPMLRRELSNFIGSIGKGRSWVGETVPRSAVNKARGIGNYLREQGIDPSKARIAVVGTGGTGKSTTAKALSEEMGMKVRHLDEHMDSGKELTTFLKSNPIERGTVAEQTHLLSKVDPDKFDVIVRLTTPMSKIKDQLMQRGRGASQWDAYDYPLLHQTISNAFNLTAGVKKKVGPGVSVKIKPSTGFRSNSMIQEAASNAGINVSGLDRHQKLTSLAANKRISAPGLLPYVRKGPIAEALALTVGGGVAGAGAGAGVASVVNDQKRNP
jgi:hypothetical protein